MRISKDIVTISIVCAGSRATGYINALEKYYSGKFKVVAVADLDKSKRDYFQKIYDIILFNVNCRTMPKYPI